MRRLYRRDSLVIGFALFSMFFGAGNVIFPPYLGLQSGSQWLLGFVCYYLADIGLALVAIFAMLRRGSAESITQPIGRVGSTILMGVIILCIGPMLAIPRTAASTYEMALLPLFPKIGAPVFSAVFFLVIFLLCVRESAVVNIVGKVLTPVLLLGLIIMIVRGVVVPIGPVPAVPAVPAVPNVPENGIKAGYQTMDVLAAMVFGIIVLKSAESKGHTQMQDKFSVVAGASLIAGAALLVVYLGLTYLGVTTSSLFDTATDRTTLVVSIVYLLMGRAGIVLFSIVVALACITTAVALVSASANFFSNLSGGRLSYPLLASLICVFSAVASNVGLEQLVSISAPILDVVYPPTLVLILLAFFGGQIQNHWVFRLAALGALLTSLLGALNSVAGVSISLLRSLPLASLGFGWVLPATIGGCLGALIRPKKS